ncbi:MAG: FHA domain-containing protein [Verrucomicrobiia bacterium]
MAKLSVISGKNKGLSIKLDKFPFTFGRADNADLSIDEEGVFDRHFQITHIPGDGYYIEAFEPALVAVNDLYITKTRLKNGDFIQSGNVKLRFWLAEVKQKNFIFREIIIWFWLTLLTFGQVFVIYWLLKIAD